MQYDVRRKDLNEYEFDESAQCVRVGSGHPARCLASSSNFTSLSIAFDGLIPNTFCRSVVTRQNTTEKLVL